MKFLFDFFPVLLFFVAYKGYAALPAPVVDAINTVLPLGLRAGEARDAMFFATLVAILAAFVQVGAHWLRTHRFETMHVVSLALIAVFGGLTLALHDPLFFKWKPTLLNWLFGIVIIGSQFIGQKPIMERLMAHAITVPAEAWRNVNLAWGVFFLTMGLLNLYVAYGYSEETWVNFKLFGLTGLTFAFVILQSVYLARFMPDEEPQQQED